MAEWVAWGRRRLLEVLRCVVDAGLARQGSEHWWVWQLGLLLISTLFFPSSAFPFLVLASTAELARSACCWPALPVPAGDGLSNGLLSAHLLAGVPRGGRRARLLLIHRRILPSR